VPSFIGIQGLLVLIVVLLLLFGAKRLPATARALGRGVREFTDAVTDRGVERRRIASRGD
jgi:sec-independent protein translocase protein TatA